MIIKEFRLPDDTAETYRQEANERAMPVVAVLIERLEHAQALDPRNPFLIIEGRNRERLEAILGRLPIRDVETLIERTRRLASVKFGDHEIELTPGQMEELKWRAVKQGKSVEEMIRLAAERFQEVFFTLIPAQK